ncbi:Hypothetical protein FKW44_001405, partial [Caligus rogercresseyi]
HGIVLNLLTYIFVEKQRKKAEFLANAIKRLVLSFLDGEELALVAAVNEEDSLHVPLLGGVFTSDKAT